MFARIPGEGPPFMSLLKVAKPQYMESGFHDMLTADRSSEDYYRPASLVVEGISASLPETTPNASDFRQVATGDLSWSTGQRGLSKFVDTGEAEITVHAESDAPEFCDPDVIHSLKATKLAVPPSKYTGLMRRYVQSLYGSDRRDYMWAGDPAGPMGDCLSISRRRENFAKKYVSQLGQVLNVGGGVLLPNWGSSTGILYDSRSRAHVLIVASLTGISYRVMRRNYPVDVEEWTSEEEHTRLLASLTPGDTLRAVDIDLSGLSEYFFPAYGWKFSSDGSSAIGVAFREAWDEEDNPKGYQTTVVRLSFTYEHTTRQLTATLDQGADTLFIPGSLAAFLVPSITDSGRGQLHFWRQYAGIEEELVTGEAPVYAYYDESDEERIGYISFGGRGITGHVDGTHYGDPRDSRVIFHDYPSPPVGGGSMSGSLESYPAANTLGDVGVRSGAISYAGGAAAYSGARNSYHAEVNCGTMVYPPVPFVHQPSFWSRGYDVSEEDWDSYYTYYHSVWSGGPYSPEEIEVNTRRTTMGTAGLGLYGGGQGHGRASLSVTIGGGYSTAFVFIIPWDDASSVVLGSLRLDNSSTTWNYTYPVYGGNSKWWFKTLEGGFQCAAGWTAFGAVAFAEPDDPAVTQNPITATATFSVEGNGLHEAKSVMAEGSEIDTLTSLFTPPTGAGTLPPFYTSYVSAATTAEGASARWTVKPSVDLADLVGDWPDSTYVVPVGTA